MLWNPGTTTREKPACSDTEPTYHNLDLAQPSKKKKKPEKKKFCVVATYWDDASQKYYDNNCCYMTK